MANIRFYFTARPKEGRQKRYTATTVTLSDQGLPRDAWNRLLLTYCAKNNLEIQPSAFIHSKKLLDENQSTNDHVNGV